MEVDAANGKEDVRCGRDRGGGVGGGGTTGEAVSGEGLWHRQEMGSVTGGGEGGKRVWRQVVLRFLALLVEEYKC
jgi:hypothetical protein